jgi:predicted HAD superfamily hydrolase
VAAPALAGYTVWVLREARALGVQRLRFLSRDGQVLYELARQIAPPLGIDLDLEYVYSSRLTWSLAATDPDRLDQAAWLFNSMSRKAAGRLLRGDAPGGRRCARRK